MADGEWRTEIDPASGVAMILGSIDPSQGDGAPAGAGSLYLRRTRLGTQTFRKLEGGPAAWVPIATAERCDVRQFGAVGDGVADDTASVRAALAACQSGDPAFGSELYFPPGKYLLTNGLQIVDDRVHIRGAGLYVSTIVFRPSTAAVLFDFGKNDGVLYQCSLADVSLVGEGSAQKIAIRATDTSVLTVENISTRLWAGGGPSTPSIALQLRGRELCTVRRVSLFADRPISIEDNPRHTIDLDHAHFQDLYLGVLRTGESSVVIAGSANLTNVVFDGTNAFVNGRHGILWEGDVGGAASLNLRLSNIRCEQANASGGYAVLVSHYVQNLLIENVHADVRANGFLLHGVRYATLLNCLYPGQGIALDIDSPANYDVAVVNCFFQAGSALKQGNMRQAFSLHKAVAGSPVAPVAFFDNARDPNPFIVLDGVRRFSHTGRLGAGEQRAIPFPFGGSPVGVVQLAARDAAGGLEAGSWTMDAARAVRISGTPRTADTNAPNTLCLFILSPGAAMIRNNLDRPVSYVVSVDWSAA
jgi:hypothetical protein